MKKLSKISESIWSDIQDRSSGDVTRIEDDIDLMDKDRFFDYLHDLYTKTSTIYEMRLYSVPYDCILVPISINGLWKSSSVSYLGLEGFEDPKGMVVTLDARSITRLTEEVVGELSKKYNIKCIPESSKRQAYVKITPKDGSPVTNTFYIEVIDFLLDNIKDGYNKLVKKKINVNESIWSDLQDRSSGEVTRKEDDINHLDFEELIKYVKDRYEVQIPNPNNFFAVGGWFTPETSIGRISIPIEQNDSSETPNLGNRMLAIDLFKDGTLNIGPNKYIFRLYPNELKKAFPSTNYEFIINPGEPYDYIKPKNGEVTNNMCVDAIDKILDIVERPILRIKK